MKVTKRRIFMSVLDIIVGIGVLVCIGYGIYSGVQTYNAINSFWMGFWPYGVSGIAATICMCIVSLIVFCIIDVEDNLDHIGSVIVSLKAEIARNNKETRENNMRKDNSLKKESVDTIETKNSQKKNATPMAEARKSDVASKEKEIFVREREDECPFCGTKVTDEEECPLCGLNLKTNSF